MVRYTNVSSWESIIRNLNGDALIDLRPNGSIARITLVHGHLAVGLGATDPGGPAFLVLQGRRFAVDFALDGSRAITFGAGDAAPRDIDEEEDRSHGADRIGLAL